MIDDKKISRKNFIKEMGYTAAGIVAAGSLGGLLTGCSTSAPAADVDTSQAPQHPFPYKKLDPSVAEARAYQGYKEKGG